MSNGLFKVVFKGEIGFDFDQEEVKANLRKFSGFSAEKIDRLFSGGVFALKKEVDIATAERFRDALQRLGALADIEPMIAPEPAAIPRYLESVPVAMPFAKPLVALGTTSCPACGRGPVPGEVCSSCGVVIAKFVRAQERRAREEEGVSFPALETGPRPGSFLTWGKVAAGKTLLAQCAGLILAMFALQGLLGRGLEYLGYIILPVVYLLYLLVRALAANRELAEGLEEAFGLEWAQAEEAQGLTGGSPRWTYGLVLLALVLYYDLVVFLDPGTLRDNFAFVPAAPTFWNVPLSAVTALVLHENGWQLWGSVLFLWVVGSGVEDRLGRNRMLLVFLVAGMAAAGCGTLAHLLLLQGPLHGLGLSGAIAGLFGLFAAGRIPRQLEFSPPLIGLALLRTSLRVTLRLDALACLALFFYANLPGGLVPESGLGGVAVGFCANLGGFLAGLAIGYGLPPEALEEDRTPPGSDPGR